MYVNSSAFSYTLVSIFLACALNAVLKSEIKLKQQNWKKPVLFHFLFQTPVKRNESGTKMYEINSEMFL